MPVKIATVEGWVELYDPTKKCIAYTAEKGIVVRLSCLLCTRFKEQLRATIRNYSTSFVDGVSGNSLKIDNVKKHMKSDMHKKAQNLENGPSGLLKMYQTTPIGRAFSSVSDAHRTQVAKLFDVAHTICKEEMAFTKYEAIVKVEQKHGVQLGTAYHTRKSCAQIVTIMGEVMEEDLAKLLISAPYFSIMIDGATDVSITEKELIYAMFITPTGHQELRFVRLKNMTSGTAVGIHEAISNVFDDIGVTDWRDKLVAFVADGAAVNLGVKKSVSVLLKQRSPWMISLHCFNHRLELAVKDALSNTFFAELSALLNSLYTIYNKSCKRLREARKTSETLKTVFIKPRRVEGTRWVTFKLNAIKAVVTSYPVLVTHLRAMTQTNEGDPKERTKFKELVEELTSFRVVSNLLLFSALLQPVSNFSLKLQGDTVDIMYAINGLAATKQNIDKAAATPDLRKLIEKAEQYEHQFSDDAAKTVNEVCFKGVILRDVSGGLLSLYANQNRYVRAITDAIDERFDSVIESSVFICLKILDTAAWPKEAEALSEYGNYEIETLQEHFGQLLDKHNVDLAEILPEWNQLKQFHRVMEHLDRKSFWQFILSEHKTTFANLHHLISILLLFPVSNAILERFFSVMKRVKSDWRASLGEKTLEHLLRVGIESPDVDKFDPQRYVARFFETPRRPTAKRSGPQRKKRKITPESATRELDGILSDDDILSDSVEVTESSNSEYSSTGDSD